MSISLCRYHKQILSNHEAVVGSVTWLFLSPEILDCVNSYLQLCNSATSCVNERAWVFYWLEVNGQLFYSAQYGCMHKRNSYTIMYTDVTGQRKFGFVQYFIVTPGDVVLVVVRTLVQLGVTCQEHFQLTSPAVDKASMQVYSCPGFWSTGCYFCRLLAFRNVCIFILVHRLQSMSLPFQMFCTTNIRKYNIHTTFRYCI